MTGTAITRDKNDRHCDARAARAAAAFCRQRDETLKLFDKRELLGQRDGFHVGLGFQAGEILCRYFG